MLYVVGGCSRSGKSTLAERMRSLHGIPWFPLDALMMGLHLGAPACGVHPDGDDFETADRMWPILKGILEHLIFDGRDYLVEGATLRPRIIAQFIAENDEPVKTCFLGYPDAAIETKAIQLAHYNGVPTDWLHRTGPDNVRRFLEISRAQSCRLRDECAALDIPFFDTGSDFQAGIASAERMLTDLAE